MRRQYDGRVVEPGDAPVQGLEKILRPRFDLAAQVRPADGLFEERVAGQQIAVCDQIANRAWRVAGRGENANGNIPHPQLIAVSQRTNAMPQFKVRAGVDEIISAQLSAKRRATS